MKAAFIFAAAGLLLVSARPPELDSVVAADAPAKAAPAAVSTARPRPVTVAGDYPPCSATRTDRCTQVAGKARGYRPVPKRRMQLAMRAGERG